MTALKDVQKRRGLTQEQLAERSGVKQTLISLLERQPDPNPTWFTIRRLMRALDAHPHDFLRATPPKHRGVAV